MSVIPLTFPLFGGVSVRKGGSAGYSRWLQKSTSAGRADLRENTFHHEGLGRLPETANRGVSGDTPRKSGIFMATADGYVNLSVYF
jgi:hypothetical protein